MHQLVLANDALFGDTEVSILTLANDRALIEVLSLARSSMVRTFPADNISILMTLIAIKIKTVMIRGTADLDFFLTASGDTSSSDMNTVLMVTHRASSFHRRGFHLACC